MTYMSYWTQQIVHLDDLTVLGFASIASNILERFYILANIGRKGRLSMRGPLFRHLSNKLCSQVVHVLL